MKLIRRKKYCHYLAILYLICCFGLLFFYPRSSLQQLNIFSSKRENNKSKNTLIKKSFIKANKLGSIRNIGNNKTATFYGKDKPKVLIWTKFFEADPLQAVGSYRKTQSQFCHVQCDFTSDRKLLQFSDAIIFHSRDIRSDDLPPFYTKDQLLIYLQQESPANTRPDLPELPIAFNWTMTYRRDSDVFHPYGKIIPVVTNQQENNDKASSQNMKKYFNNKSKLVAWVVSNCNTPGKREDFVYELKRHISVDIYGACGDYRCERGEGCFAQIEKEYKFYLSFENSICSEYVTEKFFNALNRAIVPVVYGYGNYSQIAPPNSFIDALSFQSPEKLAKYLLFLDKNPAMYLEFFKWKPRYKVIKSDGWCTLCDKLTRRGNTNKHELQYYTNLWKWWNYFIDENELLEPKSVQTLQNNDVADFTRNVDSIYYNDRSEPITVSNLDTSDNLIPICLEPPKYPKEPLSSKLYRRLRYTLQNF